MNTSGIRTRTFFVFLLSGFLWSCASGGSPGSEGEEARRNPNLITEAELQELPSGTARSAVERLRPAWLRSRTGDYPRVFLDDRDYGSMDALFDFNLDLVAEIRYMPPRDATIRYGTGYPGGIIYVLLKRPS